MEIKLLMTAFEAKVLQDMLDGLLNTGVNYSQHLEGRNVVRSLSQRLQDLRLEKARADREG